MSDLAFALNAPQPAASSAYQPRLSRAEAADDNDAFRAELVKADRPTAPEADRRRVDIQPPAERDPADPGETNSVQEQAAPVAEPDSAQTSPEKYAVQKPDVIRPQNSSPKTDAAIPLEVLVEKPIVAAPPIPILPELPALDATPAAPEKVPEVAIGLDALTPPAPIAPPVALAVEPKLAIKPNASTKPAPVVAANPAPAITSDPAVPLTTAPPVNVSAPTTPAITQSVDADQVAPALLGSVLTQAVAPRPSENAATPTAEAPRPGESADTSAAIAKPLAAHTSAPAGANIPAPRPDGGASAPPAQSNFVVPDQSAAPAPAVKGASPETLLPGDLAPRAEAAPPQTPSVAGGALGAHASLTPPPTTIQVQTGAPRLAIPAEALAYEIKRQQSNGINRFEIRLEPAELGRIDVRLEVADDGTTRAHLSADRPETLDLLQRDSRQLERALQSLGLRTDRDALAFSLRQDGAAEGGDNRPGRDGEGRAATGAGAFAAPEEDIPTALAAAVGRYDSMRINIVI
jgi:flagellar hook-length control protein FliK